MRNSTFAVVVVALLTAGTPLLPATDMGEIVSAETRSGSIAATGQTDSFWFTGQLGQGVVINLTKACSSSSFYPEVRLYDPLGGLEASDWSSTNAEIQNHQLAQTGGYTLLVKDFNGTATCDYRISLLLIPGAATSSSDPDGGSIQSAGTGAGTIDTWADTDAFTFVARTGDGVVIDLTKACSSSSFYPEVRLYDPLGGLEASDWSSTNAEIQNHQLLQTGVYTIVAKDFNGTTSCDYRVSLLIILGPTVSSSDQDGGTIASGQVNTGTISVESDTDAFAMAGQVGNTVEVNLTKTCGNVSFYPEVRLYDPLGGLETSAWSSTNAQIQNHQLLQTGVYTLVAKDFNGVGTCDYSLSLTKIPPTVVLSCSASATPVGTAVSFAASVSGGSGPYTWEWWFGDGELSSAQNPSHVYPESVTYAWYVIVRDSGGNGCVQYGFLDALGAAIFADGFESGGTSAWSTATP